MKNGFLTLFFKELDDIRGELVTEMALLALFDGLYDHLDEDEAIVLLIKKDCTVVCTRKRGRDDKILKKFTNIGFGTKGSRILIEAVKPLAENLPEYCYEAISGDKAALRRTTEHLHKVYGKKIERMRAKKQPAKEIARVLTRQDEISRFLELSDDELVDVIDAVLIEIPKNPELFEDLDELVAAIDYTDTDTEE